MGGATSLVKDGGGLLILSMANNTYSGGTFVANGTLRVGSNYALGQITHSIAVQPGATLEILMALLYKTRS